MAGYLLNLARRGAQPLPKAKRSFVAPLVGVALPATAHETIRPEPTVPPAGHDRAEISLRAEGVNSRESEGVKSRGLKELTPEQGSASRRAQLTPVSQPHERIFTAASEVMDSQKRVAHPSDRPPEVSDTPLIPRQMQVPGDSKSETVTTEIRQETSRRRNKEVRPIPDAAPMVVTRPPKVEIQNAREESLSRQTGLLPVTPLRKPPRIEIERGLRHDSVIREVRSPVVTQAPPALVPQSERADERKKQPRQKVLTAVPPEAENNRKPDVDRTAPPTALIHSRPQSGTTDSSPVFSVNRSNGVSDKRHEGPRLAIGRLEIQIIQEETAKPARGAAAGQQSDVDVWEHVDRQHTRQLGGL